MECRRGGQIVYVATFGGPIDSIVDLEDETGLRVVGERWLALTETPALAAEVASLTGGTIR